MSKTIKDDLERTQKADLSEAEIKGIYYQQLGEFCLACTPSAITSQPVYDVLNFDMIVMIRTPFVPGCVQWIFK
eukprot:scaffold302623_cov18-Tisochrysis_lutea.AAC.1